MERCGPHHRGYEVGKFHLVVLLCVFMGLGGSVDVDSVQITKGSHLVQIHGIHINSRNN